MCFIALFFHKLFQKETTDNETGLKLTDLLEKYIFPQNQVKLSTQIGKSVFGLVHKGYAHRILPHETVTLVAIKVVKGSTDAANITESQKVKFATKICNIQINAESIYDDFSFRHFSRCYNAWDLS